MWNDVLAGLGGGEQKSLRQLLKAPTPFKFKQTCVNFLVLICQKVSTMNDIYQNCMLKLEICKVPVWLLCDGPMMVRWWLSDDSVLNWKVVPIFVGGHSLISLRPSGICIIKCVSFMGFPPVFFLVSMILMILTWNQYTFFILSLILAELSSVWLSWGEPWLRVHSDNLCSAW